MSTRSVHIRNLLWSSRVPNVTLVVLSASAPYSLELTGAGIFRQWASICSSKISRPDEPLDSGASASYFEAGSLLPGCFSKPSSKTTARTRTANWIRALNELAGERREVGELSLPRALSRGRSSREARACSDRSVRFIMAFGYAPASSSHTLPPEGPIV